MAIAGIPQNFVVQEANQQILLTWDIATGALTYDIQRSTDNITFSSYTTVSVNTYLDSTVTVGTQYWYKVASVNASGTSAYTSASSAIPTPNGEMTLSQIRLQAQQRADRVNSQFVTTAEWNTYINQSLYELYDLLITTYEDYFVGTPLQFTADGSTFLYPLPDGKTTYTSGITGNTTFVAPGFYKLAGVDLGLQNTNNAYVSLNKFNFIDRNRFVYPNTASSIYGVFNLQYRLVGSNLMFIPTPSAGQVVRVWYYPRMTMLLQDTDTTTQGISGWMEYVITDAAIKALQKEESDVTILGAQKMMLIQRIEASAMNRDAGQPDKISDTRQNSYWGNGFGWNGSVGGFSLLPGLMFNNVSNVGLSNAVHSCETILRNTSLGILGAYVIYRLASQFSGRIKFSRIRDSVSHGSSAFYRHIRHVLFLGSNEQMTRINTKGDIASVADFKSSRSATEMEFPRNSMSLKPSLFSVAVRFFSKIWSKYTNLAVSIGVPGSSPQPASARLVNLTPKSLGNYQHSNMIQDNRMRSQG